ncbi:MAG: hypothetical protein RMA76_41615 [Deltaproteobacteria bacterium]
MTLSLALEDQQLCTHPGDLMSLPPVVVDNHVVVVAYGGEDLRIVHGALAWRGLDAAVARIGAWPADQVRARLLEMELDATEASALGALDVQMVEALAEDTPQRRAVLAGYVLIALRNALRNAPRTDAPNQASGR